jgi:glycosyltransferase involved in cell wall biosynthesis
MKKIGVLGHFAIGTNMSDGQTIKTRVVGEELRRIYQDEVDFIDTYGGWRFLFRLPVVLLQILINYKNIIIMPAHNGIRIISPLLVIGNLFFHRSIHYVVIGGWLAVFAKKYPLFRFFIRQFDGIYVESDTMRRQLQELSFTNAILMPNCKPLHIVTENDIPHSFQSPLKVCTFSRIIKEKGIEDAILAVNECNKKMGRTIYILDIFGQADRQQEAWFKEMMSQQPDEIQYKGIVPFDKSTETLKDYFALLFPTYYEGECFAGTLIDAMASGIPAIASDWHENANIVINGKTGIIFPVHDLNSLTDILTDLASHPEDTIGMRHSCIQRAKEFLPEKIIKTLTDRLV